MINRKYSKIAHRINYEQLYPALCLSMLEDKANNQNSFINVKKDTSLLVSFLPLSLINFLFPDNLIILVVFQDFQKMF